MIKCCNADHARGMQGTESLLLDSRLSLQDAPPVFGALGVIGVSGMASCTD